jgi:hypothetical protein
MPPPYHDVAEDKIESSLENIDAAVIGTRSEASGVRKDGSIFPLDLAMSKIEQFGLFTGIVRDITARKETEAKLEQYRKNLQVASSELMLAQTLGKHFGLCSVRERLEYIGGSFKIQSAPVREPQSP